MSFKHGSKATFYVTSTTSASNLAPWVHDTNTDPSSNPVSTDTNNSHTFVNISATLKSVQFSPAADTAETSALGTTYKTHVAGLQDASISFDGHFDSGSTGTDATIMGILGREYCWWVYRPQGDVSGTPQYFGYGILHNYQVTTAIGDVGSFTAQLHPSGGWTRNTVP